MEAIKQWFMIGICIKMFICCLEQRIGLYLQGKKRNTFVILSIGFVIMFWKGIRVKLTLSILTLDKAIPTDSKRILTFSLGIFTFKQCSNRNKKKLIIIQKNSKQSMPSIITKYGTLKEKKQFSPI